MVAPSVGSVVLVSFPFSDLSAAKRRPALVLSGGGRDDWLLCQITSNPYSDLEAIASADGDFDTGSLQKISYARPGKLFTANASLIVSSVGILSIECHQMIVHAITRIIVDPVAKKKENQTDNESENEST